MSRESVIVVGSGAGGSVAAWALRRRGHPVLILEKGRNLLPGLGGRGPVRTLFSNDEVKAGRYFENQDPLLEPRTSRTQAEARRGVARSFVGDVNDLPTTVAGGGTVHWDAKVPRFWRQDFKGRSLHGPVPGANVADWPLTYEELAPFYDEVERRLGRPGRRPADARGDARPGPPRAPVRDAAQSADVRAASCSPRAAQRLGYSAYPFPMAVNSREHLGRPACNSCGFCSGFGCPINARGGAALSFLHDALRRGAELRTRCFVHRVDVTRDGRRARGVGYLDAKGRRHTVRADVVVLAPSAIETARLLLMSRSGRHPRGLGNRSDQLGRNLMFHYFTLGIGLFTENVHAWRGPSTTFTIDDFVGPVKGKAARAAGLPYLKGGICEVGGQRAAPPGGPALRRPGQPRSRTSRSLLRDLALRDRLAGMSMVGEDLPQKANRVDLDPRIRDFHGLPVPRITHSQHRFELAASAYFGPKLAEICRAAPKFDNSARALVDALAGQSGSTDIAGANATAHIMGTARMGARPAQIRWSTRSVACTSSTTSTSPTARCSPPRAASTRR